MEKENVFTAFKNKNRGIERHTHLFITLEDDPIKVIYCAQCWDIDEKIIQVNMRMGNHFTCPLCKNIDYVPYEEFEEIETSRRKNKVVIRNQI